MGTVDPARALREARRRAGLTQRQLAAKTGVKQSAIARIESGRVVPRIDTLDRLLEACGEGLYAEKRMGVGTDRTLIRALRGLPAGRRVEENAREAAQLASWTGIALPAHVAERPEPYGSLDVRRAFDALVRHGVRFIVIGGLAARAHGSPLITHDMDVFYARDGDNLARLARALEGLHASLRGAPPGLPNVIDERFLRNGLNFTFSTDAGPLDCLGEPAGIGAYAEVERNTVEAAVAGVRVLVASVSDLLRMKRAAGRTKDIPYIEWLAAVQEEIDAEERRRGRE